MQHLNLLLCLLACLPVVLPGSVCAWAACIPLAKHKGSEHQARPTYRFCASVSLLQTTDAAYIHAVNVSDGLLHLRNS